jgi:hypothetical protein
MVKTLTGKFIVETVWPELINKRVRQIESNLKEVQFFNRGDSLLAKGSLKRQVKYLDSSGKLRKTEDKLQFEVIIGSALPEPLPYFITKLQSDYFIFQPRRLGESHAILEQGFTLIINEFEGDTVGADSFGILAEAIVDKGEGEAVYYLPINLQQDSHPKQFNGKLVFEPSKPPLATGIITGVLIYRDSRQNLKELEVNHSFSLLLESAPKEPEGELTVTGAIEAVNWVSPTGGQGWIAELRLNYHWNLVINKEITVLGRVEQSNQAESMIKADLLIKEECLRFSKSIKVERGQDAIGQVEVEPLIKKLDWQRIGSGLLISAMLNFDLFSPDITGIEKYRTIPLEIQELTEGFFDKDHCLDLTLKLEPKLVIDKITDTEKYLLINTTLNLTVKLYQSRLIYLIHENATIEINGLTPVTKKEFSLLSETIINLKHPPLKIIQIRNRLLQINPSAKKRWLNLSGVSEVAIVYLDRQNQYREELYNFDFDKSFCWEGNVEDEGSQIDLHDRLEYDSYRIEGNQVYYTYLRNFTAALFKKQILKAAVSSGQKKENYPENFTHLQQKTIQKLSIQGEASLQFGNPREIAGGRGIVAEFNWCSALNAILIEGKIKGEIEYWDEDGFFRCETVEVSFWRFLNRSERMKEDVVLIPIIKRLSYYPLRPWPWRKGAVLYEADLEINI